MMALHKAIEVNGELVAESFVDDLTFLSNSQSTMLRSKTCVVSPTGSGCAKLAFHQRELLCSSLFMSKVLFGKEVTDLSAA